MIGQLSAQSTRGGEYNLLNSQKITYALLLKWIATYVPTKPKWGIEASEWAWKMRWLQDSIVDIDTWSGIVRGCLSNADLLATDPFLRKVLHHLEMFTGDIPNGKSGNFRASLTCCRLPGLRRFQREIIIKFGMPSD